MAPTPTCFFCGSPDPTHLLAPVPLILAATGVYGLTRLVPERLRLWRRRWEPGTSGAGVAARTSDAGAEPASS